MGNTPRIITVDATGTIARIVRSAMDLLDLSIIQTDVPNSIDALEETKRANLVVTAFNVDENMKGFEFALRVKQQSPDISVIILGDEDDPDDFDEETSADSPFVYMSRPVDIHQFLRVLIGGLESHEAMMRAKHAPAVASASAETMDLGPVPNLEIARSKTVVDVFRADVGAMSAILVSRSGEILLESGAAGYADNVGLAQVLSPVMSINYSVKDLVAGQVSTVQLYDGENFDIFVLSVGLHHFLVAIFDGQQGARNFGGVNRYGRKAVEDLIGLLGANAFLVLPSVKKEEPPKRQHVKKVEVKEEPIELARAEIPLDKPKEVEPVIKQLEPLKEIDLDALFGSDVSVDDNLFDIEKMDEMSSSSQQGKTFDWDWAQDAGILPGN
jgi:DNA-binding NarL/FixJ family response regulator